MLAEVPDAVNPNRALEFTGVAFDVTCPTKALFTYKAVPGVGDMLNEK